MLKKVRILAIDDNADILYALRSVFEYKNWEAITALSVNEGVEKFKKYHPNIVIIDYHMPKINGIVGVELIRKLSSTVPIIVLTIEESIEISESFFKAGATDFALKPIKAPDIISRIQINLKLNDSLSHYQGIKKGISQSTLQLVRNYFKDKKEPLSVQEISSSIGLAPQTVHRYVQFLEESGELTLNQSYGKIGRPILYYELKK